jgi:uncharacterized protein involved in oxidation of intracellular sulfur
MSEDASDETADPPGDNPEDRKVYVLVLNDAPYGSERPYNGLRLALNLAKRNPSQVRVFLMGDGVLCARKGRAIPQGYYNVERMLRSPAMRGEVAT